MLFSDRMGKTVRVDEETYRRLCEEAGRLQAVLRRPVSLDEAVRYLVGAKFSAEISDLAGSWKVSEEEVESIKKSLEEGWRGWSTERCV